MSLLFAQTSSLYDNHDVSLVKHQEIDVPFIPKCKGAGDASNYDTYDEEDIKSSSTEKFAKEFADF